MLHDIRTTMGAPTLLLSACCQVLLLKSGQLQELNSDWQVELQLPPRQLQVIRQVKAAVSGCAG
jgi:hypothetical protein